jgi:maltoporin
MGVSSDTARALYKVMRIPRVAPQQNDLDAAEHLPGTPRVDNLASGYLDFDSEVSFYSGNRVYRDSVCHMIFSFFLKRTLVSFVITGLTTPGKTA